jgi:hypothetical protein
VEDTGARGAKPRRQVQGLGLLDQQFERCRRRGRRQQVLAAEARRVAGVGGDLERRRDVEIRRPGFPELETLAQAGVLDERDRQVEPARDEGAPGPQFARSRMSASRPKPPI